MLSNIAPTLYAELLKIATHPHWHRREQVVALSDLLTRLFMEATKQEQLAFSTLFARISYAGHKFNFQPETLRKVHIFRRIADKARQHPDPESVREKDLSLGIEAVAETILVLTGSALPPEIIDLLAGMERFELRPQDIWNYKSQARVVAVKDDPDNFCLICLDEESPEQKIRVRYGISDRNENFSRSVQSIRKTFGFPIVLNLLEVDIDQYGEYRPRAFVIEPDYLVDISAIAECFKDTGVEPLSYLAKKFLPMETTPAILLGNIANHFLDRLMSEPDVAWRTLIAETFQLYPFVFAPMSDAEVKEITNKSQKHFLNILRMAKGGFAQEGIDPQHCFLEPTFYSQAYGIQGRLDLFYKTEDKAAIVELKGGSVWKPNSYGISRSHFTQTLLYDLLVRSVFGKLIDPAKYILYSGQDLNQLRFAPTVPSEQFEALQARNQLVAIERRLANIKPGEETVPMLLQLKGSIDGGKGFLARDFGLFEATYSHLNPTERKYFNAFAGFIAREQFLAKIGQDDLDNVNGSAALWRSAFADKNAGFSILSHLEIIDNQANAPDPYIIFKKTANTNPLANFRVGDIAVLYPAHSDESTVLESQIIKCTITELGKEQVRAQLRFRQFNMNPFQTEEGGYWNMEPDMMENGFVNMHRGLFEWASAKPEKRDMLMTKTPPRQPIAAMTMDNETNEIIGFSDNNLVDDQAPAITKHSPSVYPLTEEQQEIFQKIIESQDYFLLWGPPGTGKTSVMLRALAEHWHADPKQNILLLAYTNRAVDEICEALDSLSEGIRDEYIRIGSRFSTAEHYRSQLLHTKISGVKSRADLRAILEKHRIFVGTVASFASNDNLLKIKKFDRLVIDEASQLLEPQLLGLLSRFNHFVLIGDHKQLPAITVQAPQTTRVEDADLHNIGVTDLRDSYFERLYRRCIENHWDWAYARLSHQGRMHAEIMDFPNCHFYGGFLKTLPAASQSNQNAPLNYQLEGLMADFEQKLTQKRVVFLPTISDETMVPGQKTNRYEAELVAKLTVFFKKLFAENNMPWRPSTLGIITPWRAQIAQIRQALMSLDQDPDEFTIDTVERYQGGARDIILMSCCVNSHMQLGSLVSLSEEGVDRKLNVALTRARQHVVLLGNPDILKLDDRYKQFLEDYQ